MEEKSIWLSKKHCTSAPSGQKLHCQCRIFCQSARRRRETMRYMLLHELQHYKHHDAIGSFLMNLAGVVYWFNPFVWYSLKKMCNDREIACDTSVLEMLADDAYEDYGTALINFAEKVSLTPFPFAAGLSGNRKQIKQRISNIASYEKPTFIKKLKSLSMERLLRKYFLHRPICILWRI